MLAVAFDLETTELSGMIGRILCCSFKPLLPNQKGRVYTLRGDGPRFRRANAYDDSRLAIAIRDELERYDLLVGHNSKLFDKKFLQARLFRAGAKPLQPQFHIDTMWTVRTHLRMSSKLDNVQKFLHLPDEKTPISWEVWSRAHAGERRAMDEVVHHCEQDVRVLEEVYWRLLPYIRTIPRC